QRRVLAIENGGIETRSREPEHGAEFLQALPRLGDAFLGFSAPQVLQRAVEWIACDALKTFRDPFTPFEAVPHGHPVRCRAAVKRRGILIARIMTIMKLHLLPAFVRG